MFLEAKNSAEERQGTADSRCLWAKYMKKCIYNNKSVGAGGTLDQARAYGEYIGV